MPNNMNEFYSSNELMVCKYCGNNIPIRARYCTYCNHQLNQDYLVKNEFVNNKQDMPYHSHSQNQPYSTNHQNIPINPYATNNRNVVNNPSVPNNQYSANNAQQTNQSRYHNPGFTQMNNIHSAQPHLQGANVAANFSSAITHCPNCNNLINPGSLLAIGGHVVWAAIAGAALVAVKQDKPFSVKMLFNIHFLKIFVIPVVLHAVWDMPIEFIIFNYIFVVKTVLIILAWVVTLALISRGLKQISEISKKYSNSAVNVNNPMR